jgi:FtsH-binding integral membrane protein
MSNYDVNSILQSPAYQQELAAQRTFMARVFGWMTIGLLTTALSSLGMDFMNLGQALVQSRGLLITLIIAQLGVALVMGFMVNKIPAPVAALLFLLYSGVTGVVFSILFLVYTHGSIAGTFFITAGMFGTMAAIGYTTKKDLSGMGSMLFMALIGLIIASVVNMFMQSSAFGWLLSVAGVIIFTGLTAYDVQKIKQAYAVGEYGSAAFEKTAVFGAFTLYLEYITLFLNLLGSLGNRRDCGVSP